MKQSQDKKSKVVQEKYEIEKLDIAANKKMPMKKHMLAQAYQYCILGCTNKQLAYLLGITEPVLNAWIKHKPMFRKAIHDGRDAADAVVAESLYKRAIGYEIEEYKTYVINDRVITKLVPRTLIPDIAAQKYWLECRHRDQWSTSPSVQINNQTNVYEPIIKRFDGTVDDLDADNIPSLNDAVIDDTDNI